MLLFQTIIRILLQEVIHDSKLRNNQKYISKNSTKLQLLMKFHLNVKNKKMDGLEY